MGKELMNIDAIWIHIYLWLYYPLSGLDCFFNSRFFMRSAGILDCGSTRRKAATYTQNITNTV
jgi:hypothetical protein